MTQHQPGASKPFSLNQTGTQSRRHPAHFVSAIYTTTIREHGQSVSRLAAEISCLASGIHAKVGQALIALQIGDTTRQRIEHIQSGFELIAGSDEPPLEPGARVLRDNLVHHLALAQLTDLTDQFTTEASRVSEKLLGLSDDARDVLRLKSMFSEGQTSDFLRNLENSVGEVRKIVAQVSEVNDNAEATGRSAAGTAEALLGDVEAIRTVKTDILYMSLNTSIRCCHMGTAGLPMNVIAVELRTTSDALEIVSDNTVTNLDELAGLAAQMAASEPSGAKGARLDGAVKSIRAAGDTAETNLVAVNTESMKVAEAIENLGAYSNFHADLCALLDEACAELAELAGSRVAETERVSAIEATLETIFKSYSMSRERDVHRNAVGGSMDQVEDEVKPSDSDEDLFASALF